MRILTLCFTLMSFAALAAPQQWSMQQRGVISAMDKLAAASDVKSANISDYANLLADDFSRWTIGSQVFNDKAGWVEGVATWIKRGWSVAARTNEVLDIQIHGNFAFTRRITTEAYIGPNQQSAMSTSALAETWVREQGQWKLLQVSVTSLPNPKVSE